jgi:LPXTG-site transpeptidase (sortase) family protein
MLKKSQMKFLFYFIAVFLVAFVFLYSAGLVPKSLQTEEPESFRTLWDKTQSEAIKNQLNQAGIQAEEPVRIVIDKIGVDATVANPNSTNIATLDDYLSRGAVRYPGSGLLGAGNIFLFGHSTSLSVVNNQAYKTFNGLRDLKAGDMIKVYSRTRLYTYRVTSVVLVDENEALVDLSSSKNTLTLSTCNTFGAKSERYVVEADYITSL